MVPKLVRIELGAVGLAAMVAGFVLACPRTASAGPDGGGPVSQVCADVVGLAPGEKHFAACVQSLSDSLGSLRDGRGIALARRECRGRGYRPDTPGLAECELAAAPAGPPRGPSFNAPVPGGSRSYFVVSRATAFRRDQLACARLGFDPAQSAFAACASGLRGALVRASDPAI